MPPYLCDRDPHFFYIWSFSLWVCALFLLYSENFHHNIFKMIIMKKKAWIFKIIFAQGMWLLLAAYLKRQKKKGFLHFSQSSFTQLIFTSKPSFRCFHSHLRQTFCFKGYKVGWKREMLVTAIKEQSRCSSVLLNTMVQPFLSLSFF